MDTAERLFAERGIDAVSINEVVQTAGLNAGAVHYHFGSKAQLVGAIVERGTTAWVRVREALLDQLERSAEPTLRDVVEAMVLPTVDLWRHDDGRRYVLFLSVVASHPELNSLLLRATETHTSRILRLLEEVTPDLPADVRLLRYALAREFVYHALSIFAGPVQRWMEARGTPIDELDPDDLIDFVAGALGAPDGMPPAPTAYR